MPKKVTFEDAYAVVMQHIKARKWDKTNDSRAVLARIKGIVWSYLKLGTSLLATRFARSYKNMIVE